MNSVAPSRRLSAFKRVAQRPSGSAHAARRPSERLDRRARPVGRAARARRARRRAARASSASCAVQRVARAASRAATTAKSAYWTGSGGSGDGRPAGERRVERRQLAHEARRSTSRRRRCGASVTSRRCSLVAEPQQAGAQQRAAGEVERARPPLRRASRSRLRLARAGGEIAAGRRPAPATAPAARSPGRAARRSTETSVRSASCRRTISVRLAASAADVERGRAAAAPAACCRRRCPARAGRGTTAAAGRTTAAEVRSQAARAQRWAARSSPARGGAPRPRPASAATVGASKRARSGSSTPSAARAAGDDLRRQQRVAAELEEVVVDADAPHAQHLAPDAGQHLSASACGAARRRACRCDRRRRAAARARSTLPFGVSGSAVERHERRRAPCSRAARVRRHCRSVAGRPARRRPPATT